MDEPNGPTEPSVAQDMLTCEFCEGQFFREDMDGDHCPACSAEIFGEG